MRKKWVKLWTEEWLDGTVRYQLTPPERSIFIDLIALAGRSRQPGIIQANINEPYPHNILAQRLNVSPDLLDITLGKLAEQGRISENSNGIHIVKWQTYQTVEVKHEEDGNSSSNVQSGTPTNSSTESPALSSISKIYEDNVGQLTPLIGEKLAEIADKYPSEWFPTAVREACQAGVRKLNYIEAILERWKVEGFKSNKSKRKGVDDGKARRNPQSIPKPHEYTRPEDL